MATNFMSFLNIGTTLTPVTTTGAVTKQVLLIGQRLTAGKLIIATNGFAQPDYYKPILLPSFQNGAAALNYISSYGFKYTMGVTLSLTFVAPDSVNQANGLTQLTWNTIPANFTALVGFNLAGTISQTTPSAVSGNMRSATITTGGAAVLTVTGTIDFADSGDSGGTLTVYPVNQIQYPDPNLSDPIALMVWDFYQTYQSANVSANGSPSAYLSVLSDRDETANPSSTDITLNCAATAAQGAMTVSAGDNSSVNLTYTYTITSGVMNLDGFGYLPTTALGSSTVTQATSGATGTYNGFTVYPTSSSGGTIVVNVTGITGTFVNSNGTTNVVSVALDDTYSVFNYLDNINLHSAVLQFPITTLDQININQATFFEGVAALNAAGQVLNNHYFTYAIAGNITSLPSSAATLPAPDTQNYILVSYPYVAQFGDIPYEVNTAGLKPVVGLDSVASGRVCAAVAYMFANGDAPYPALVNSTINHLPVSSISSSTSYSAAEGSTGNIAVEQGWLPLAPNSSGVVNFLQSNTTLITDPGTGVPDTEFRYTHVWDCIRWLRYEITQTYNVVRILPNNQGIADISDSFLTQFRTGILSDLNTGENLAVVENVDLYQNLVTVTTDDENANQVDVYVPSQIIPQLNGADVQINVFSALYTFSNSQ